MVSVCVGGPDEFHVVQCQMELAPCQRDRQQPLHRHRRLRLRAKNDGSDIDKVAIRWAPAEDSANDNDDGDARDDCYDGDDAPTTSGGRSPSAWVAHFGLVLLLSSALSFSLTLFPSLPLPIY